MICVDIAFILSAGYNSGVYISLFLLPSFLPSKFPSAHIQEYAQSWQNPILCYKEDIHFVF
jgi:hypothetical protein